MCSVENTVIYAVFGIKSVQNSGFCSVFKALASKKVQCRDLPKPLKTPLFTVQLKHIIYKQSFKNIVFFSVFLHFFRQNAVIYMFFGLKSVQNTGFCSVFNALASKKNQNIAIYMVFSFLSVFPLPEADQNDPKFRFNAPPPS